MKRKEKKKFKYRKKSILELLFTKKKNKFRVLIQVLLKSCSGTGPVKSVQNTKRYKWLHTGKSSQLITPDLNAQINAPTSQSRKTRDIFSSCDKSTNRSFLEYNQIKAPL